MFYNKTILMGRLVNDPEMRTTQSGISMATFRIAVDRKYARQGEEKETDFFNVTCFRQTAEFVQRYFSKGRLILVEGKVQNDNYTDNNGVKHYGVRIVADNVTFCGDKPANGGGYGGNGYPNNGGYGNNGYPNNGGYGNNGYPNNGGYGNNGYPNNGGYGNNGYPNNGGYGNNGYGGNGGYPDNNFPPQQPAPQPASNQQSAPQPPPTQDFQTAPPSDNQKTVELGNIGDFQEIISDGDVPF